MQTRGLEAPRRNLTILKLFAFFSREKLSLFGLFFRKLHHRRQCWSSVGCSYIQKHKSVCLHSITSQLTRTASSRVLSVPLRTGAQSHACCASWSSMERRARRASLTPEDRALKSSSWIYLTHLWALGSSPAPRVGGRPRSPLFLSLLTSARTEEECGLDP